VSSPGAPQNPKLIIIDSSVLLQLIPTDQFGVLRLLKTDFGVQPAIVQAVESEVAYILQNVPKFRGRQDQLKKAIGNNTLAIVDRDLLAPILGSAVEAWIRQMESEGVRLYSIVDRGEAFTHAASMVLHAPTATNDTTAVSRLLRGGETIPRPIFRFWDFIVFAYQVGLLDAGACDRVRQALHRIGERQHRCFTNCSFEDGLSHFYARLVWANREAVGASQPQEKFDERLFLTGDPIIAESAGFS
jgi:hypothetical protein